MSADDDAMLYASMVRCNQRGIQVQIHPLTVVALLGRIAALERVRDAAVALIDVCRSDPMRVSDALLQETIRLHEVLEALP